MADILKPDLCIIGAGALGISLAIDARARDLSVVLVQRGNEVPGQTTAHRMQQAALLASANRAQAMRSAAELGLKDVDPKPGFRPIGERAASLSQAGAPEFAPERLRALGIVLRDEPASFADRQTLKVGTSIIRAAQFVLATGSRAVIPDLPGLDQVAFFTPDTILDNMRKLSHLVVIGGDPCALELAQAYRRLGSQVTLVAHGPLLPGFDREPVAVLLQALRDEGMEIFEGARVTAILPRGQGTGIAIAHDDGSLATLDVSHILLACGRVPECDDALIEQARLKRDSHQPDFLQVNAEGQTSNARVTAIGGAAGVFTSQYAQRQAAMVIQRAIGAAGAKLDARTIPRSVNTRPAIAHIGLVEGETALRPGQTVLRANAVEAEAARAAGALPGSAKLILSATGDVLGGSIIGHGAGEMIAMLAVALDRGMSAADLAGLVLPPSSPAAPLVDLGRQAIAGHRPTKWARRRAALRRLLP